MKVSVRRYARRVFASSNVNGVSHMAMARGPVRRALWAALFAVALVGWMVQSYALFTYYRRYPSVVRIEVDKPPEMEFPAITLCNVNRIRKSIFCEKFPERCDGNNIQLSEEEVFNVTYQFLHSGRKRELGHQLRDIIVSCEFTGMPALNTSSCLKYFSYLYDPFLGNCFVFSSGNGQRPKLFVREPDVWRDKRDLRVVLNVEEDEYLDRSVPPGMIVVLHEDMDMPHVLMHGLHVYSDHSYSLAIEKVTVNLLSDPYHTNCTDFERLPFRSTTNMRLSPRMCSVECLTHLQKKECPHHYVSDNVVLFSDIMPYDPYEITDEDKLCADSLSNDFKEYCSSLCNVPCHDSHFNVEMDSSPTSAHKIVVKKESLEDYKRRIGKNKTVYVSDVRIHYQTMEHKIYNHTPEFTTELLFSYLGGISGGWLGISLMECCAFAEGLCSVIVYAARAFYRQKKKPKWAHNKKIQPWLKTMRNDKVVRYVTKGHGAITKHRNKYPGT